MDMTDVMKRAAAGTAMAGALGFGILGVSSGIAMAKPGDGNGHGNGNGNGNGNGPSVSAPANPGNGNANGNANGRANVNGSINDDVDGDIGGEVEGSWGAGGNVNTAWLPGMPPGQNPFGPPGQVMKMPTLTLTNPIDLGNGMVLPVGTVLPNPFAGIAPGHWGDVNLLDYVEGLNPATITWMPTGLTVPAPLVWNPDYVSTDGSVTGAWGVDVNGTFTPYPIQFPAPVVTTG